MGYLVSCVRDFITKLCRLQAYKKLQAVYIGQGEDQQSECRVDTKLKKNRRQTEEKQEGIYGLNTLPAKSRHYVVVSVLRSVPHSAESCSEKYIMWSFKVNKEDDIRMATDGFILLASIIFKKEPFFVRGMSNDPVTWLQSNFGLSLCN